MAAGKPSTDELTERARFLADSPDIGARCDLAHDLVSAKKYELALEHYLWLWSATRSVPAHYAVRLSSMLSGIAKLAEQHAPAKTALLEILEALQARVDGAVVPELMDWLEWSSLASRFGQPERRIVWYEKRRDEAGRLFAEPASAPHAATIVAAVFEILVQADRPVDAVRLFADVRTRAQFLVGRYEQRMLGLSSEGEEARRSWLQVEARRSLTRDIVSLYAALLSAARGEEASDVAALLIRALDTPDSRLALVGAGVDAAVPPVASLTRWLDEAAVAGGDVRPLRPMVERFARRAARRGPANGS